MSDFPIQVQRLGADERETALIKLVEQLQARVEELERVYTTGLRMRETAVVDDDFPEMMHDFDSALRAATVEDK